MMKCKKLILSAGIIAICSIFMGCTGFNLSVTKKINQGNVPEEITASIQPTISNVEKAILSYDGEQLKAYAAKELLPTVDSFLESDKSLDFTHLKQTRSIGNFYFESTPVKQNVMLYAEDGDNRFTISLPWSKNEGFVQMTELLHEKISYILIEAYEKVNDTWKLRYEGTCDYSYSGNNAYELVKKMEEMVEEDDGWAARCYNTVLHQFVNPGFFPQYDELWKEHSQLNQELKQVSKKLPTTDPILLNDGAKAELVSMDGVSFNEGIGLLLYCVTDRPLSEQTQLRKDAKKIVDNYIKQVPASEKYFDLYMVQQYNEMPSDPKKTYQYYATGIFTHDKPADYEEP